MAAHDLDFLLGEACVAAEQLTEAKASGAVARSAQTDRRLYQVLRAAYYRFKALVMRHLVSMSLPAWALGSKSLIANFPIIEDIGALTILAEPDAELQVGACAARWYGAGREVFFNYAIGGKDLNDALLGGL